MPATLRLTNTTHPETMRLIKRHIDAGHIVKVDSYVDCFGVLQWAPGMTIITNNPNGVRS